jgi:hypothetical protein
MGTGHDGAGLRPNLEPSASVEAFDGSRTPLPPLAWPSRRHAGDRPPEYRARLALLPAEH